MQQQYIIKKQVVKLLGKKEKHQKKRLENLLQRSKIKQKIVILKESRYENGTIDNQRIIQ